MSELIARITLSSSRNFQISRYPNQNFHPFLVDGSNSLYEGDQLKVPPGSTVWVICQHNNQRVRVPDDGIPWAVTMACP